MKGAHIVLWLGTALAFVGLLMVWAALSIGWTEPLGEIHGDAEATAAAQRGLLLDGGAAIVGAGLTAVLAGTALRDNVVGERLANLSQRDYDARRPIPIITALRWTTLWDGVDEQGNMVTGRCAGIHVSILNDGQTPFDLSEIKVRYDVVKPLEGQKQGKAYAATKGSWQSIPAPEWVRAGGAGHTVTPRTTAKFRHDDSELGQDEDIAAVAVEVIGHGGRNAHRMTYFRDRATDDATTEV